MLFGMYRKALLRVWSHSHVLVHFVFSAMTFQHKAVYIFLLNHYQIDYSFHAICYGIHHPTLARDKDFLLCHHDSTIIINNSLI